MPAATSRNLENLPPFYSKLKNRLTNIVSMLLLIFKATRELHTWVWYDSDAEKAMFQPPFHSASRLSGSVSF